MKRNALFIAMAVLAVTAFAQAEMITDGELSSTSTVVYNGGDNWLNIGSEASATWISGSSNGQGFQLGQDPSDSGNYYLQSIYAAYVGQIIDMGGESTQQEFTLSFKYTSDNAGTNARAVVLGGDAGGMNLIHNGTTGGTVDLLDGGPILFSGNAKNTATTGNVQWETLTYTFTPTADYDYLIVGLTSSGSVSDIVGFDDISLTPEPATMSLLGLGGLALIRRRRR